MHEMMNGEKHLSFGDSDIGPALESGVFSSAFHCFGFISFIAFLFLKVSPLLKIFVLIKVRNKPRQKSISLSFVIVCLKVASCHDSVLSYYKEHKVQ